MIMFFYFQVLSLVNQIVVPLLGQVDVSLYFCCFRISVNCNLTLCSFAYHSNWKD